MSQTTERLPSRMLIGRDRLFYSGLVGNSMKVRRLGALTIYAATESHFAIKVGNGPWQSRRIFALKPFTAHRLWSPSGRITNICLEIETVDQLATESLITQVNDGPDDTRLMRRILAARREITTIKDAGGFSTSQFDQYFLRRTLPRRVLDPRIRRALDMLLDDLQDHTLAANACAAKVGLSMSRFLHLFKQDTGTTFRSQRMWKRARRFLDHANGDDSLTDVALDLGYPDSSHFSHSIRASFGLQPRSIREGSRGMQICFGENYALDFAWTGRQPLATGP